MFLSATEARHNVTYSGCRVLFAKVSCRCDLEWGFLAINMDKIWLVIECNRGKHFDQIWQNSYKNYSN